MGDLNINLVVREDGQSIEENAQTKARTYFTASHVPTLAIDGGLNIEKLPMDKQPDTLVRRIYGANRDAIDEDVLEYYQRVLIAVGGESACLWRGAMTLMLASEKIYSGIFSFKAILTSSHKGRATPGAPLDALMIDPAMGKYYTEISWQERPDTRWIGEFVKQYIGEL